MILTDREWFLLAVCAIIYIALFIVTVQNSRRKILLLEERLRKARSLQQEQADLSSQSIEDNSRRIAQLEQQLHDLGDENSVLRLQLEERKARLDYVNKVAQIEQERRQQAETVLLSADAYLHMRQCAELGQRLNGHDWQALQILADTVYTGFTEKLYGLYHLSEHEYHVCLLIKLRQQPKDIAVLTAHSKESIATTRSRLYGKVFGRKGSTRDWDEFILSI